VHASFLKNDIFCGLCKNEKKKISHKAIFLHQISSEFLILQNIFQSKFRNKSPPTFMFPTLQAKIFYLDQTAQDLFAWIHPGKINFPGHFVGMHGCGLYMPSKEGS
jgi:hypothetical protein